LTTPYFPSFFLVGTGRSGTTLLRAMLTGHPAVEIPGETGFLPRLLRLRGMWWSERGLRPAIFLRLAFANGRLARSGLDAETVARLLAEDRPYDSYQEAITRLYASFASSETRMVGDKTPGYIGHLPLLTSAFPDARVVQVVRHPLDVVASLRRQPWGPDGVRAAALTWRLDQERARDSGLAEGGRMQMVRLEDLVARPEEELQRVARHLGLDAHPSMLRFQAHAERIKMQNVHPDSHAGLSQPLRSTSRWEQELTHADAAAAWRVVEPLARNLGYHGPVDVPASRAGIDLAKARVQLAGFHAGRSWRRVRTVRRTLWP
jgi:hypothetical protein